MAISSWMIWGRSLRTNRSRRQEHESNSCVQLDLSKELKENIREALSNICQRQGVSGVKKLGYLNALARLVGENEAPDYGYRVDQVFCCLRVGLLHEATQVRAAGLRAVRYLLKHPQDVTTLNTLHYPYLLARSMDINLRNEVERMQALRLVRRMLALAPCDLSPIIARSLVSLTNGGLEEKDRGFRVFLATLCELGVLNPHLLINCGGVGALARSAMASLSPSIIESVIGVLLRLLSDPETRGSVSLLCLAAPYCELDSSPPPAHQDRGRDGREMRFTASKQALLSVMRSYPGLLHFCHPGESSGLRAIADILYVDQLPVRGAVLELLYELLGLPLPMWTDEPDVALAAIDPSRARETWKLGEGFVAAEARSIMPSLCSHAPNILELHTALLVYVFLESGLHRALAETIVTSDTFISVRAAVLLGMILHLAHSLLPPEVCDLSPALPKLLEHASNGRHEALAAVAILGRMHAMMRRRPGPSSLFLERILEAGAWLRPAGIAPTGSANNPSSRRSQAALFARNFLKKPGASSPSAGGSIPTSLIKDTHVLSSKDAFGWNWPIIRSILRSRDENLKIDSDHRGFLKQLVRYFKPGANRYSRVELGTPASREASLAACDLVNCLLETSEPEGTRLLNELIGDIAENLDLITTSQSAHDCLFSPRHVTTTCCQKYFLLIGQLSHSAKGTVILRSFKVIDKLEHLATATNHDCYVKLIISSLDFSRDGPNRTVLRRIITEASIDNSRLYATQYLLIIVRGRMSDALDWALGLLWGRLRDSSKAVALAALEILHEAAQEPDYLETIYHRWAANDHWRDLENLGDRGYLFKIRMYSMPAGLANFGAQELDKWVRVDGYAEHYVAIVEAQIHDAMTRRQRTENGTYLRRSSNNVVMLPKDVFVPTHLYGQLVQHEAGIDLLNRRKVVQRSSRILMRFHGEFVVPSEEKARGGDPSTTCTRSSRLTAHHLQEQMANFGACEGEDESPTEDAEANRLETILDDVEMTDDLQQGQKSENSRKNGKKTAFKDIDDTILKVKAALWSLGHVGTSSAGVQDLLAPVGVLEVITSIAENCPYYTLRATALYALSLVATTRAGADYLANFHWPCVRYKRGENWPIVPPRRVPVQTSVSPVPVQRHQRSLSDGKPDIPETIARRTRNRSESAVTEVEAKRYALPERGDTPSPVSSIQRLSQQDAEGYARLRSLQRHRRPSFSHSSLEMYSSDGRLSLQSLSEFESSRSWTADHVQTTPPPATTYEDDSPRYMGICLPRHISMIFPDLNRVPGGATSPTVAGGNFPENPEKSMETNPDVVDEETDVEKHRRLCLVSQHEGIFDEKSTEEQRKVVREVLRHAQRLSNPVWYRYSRQALLRLRQRHAEMFQGTCLFSEVSSRLGSGTYRLPARRFLQELFLDSKFDALYKEPTRILKMAPSVEEETVEIQQDQIRPDEESRLPVEPANVRINGGANRPEKSPEKSPGKANFPENSTQKCPENLEKFPEKCPENLENFSEKSNFPGNSEKSSENSATSPKRSNFPENPENSLENSGKSPEKSKNSENRGKIVDDAVVTSSTTENSWKSENREIEKKNPENTRIERLSDERIIAEILKPAERMSKTSDKILKFKGTNTAVGLD